MVNNKQKNPTRIKTHKGPRQFQFAVQFFLQHIKRIFKFSHLMSSFTQTNEIITKKRRCSQESHSSESSGEKLNECFRKMDLTSTNNTFKQQSISPTINHCINIPQRQQPQYSFQDMGVQQYLTLDNNQSLTDLLSQQQNHLMSFLDKICQKTNLHKIPQKSFYPFGMPAQLPKHFQSLVSQSTLQLKKTIQEENQKANQSILDHKLDQILFHHKKINAEERAKKVQRYLEKKKKRQFSQIKQVVPILNNLRYCIRSEQAQNRNRVNGKFAKQETSLYQLILQNQLSQSWQFGDKKSEMKTQEKLLQNFVKNSKDLTQST